MTVHTFTRILGWFFIIIGIAGFFTGGTLIIFEVDPVHNVIHLATGVLALLADKKGVADIFMKVFGAVYALVAVLGFAVNGDILGLIHTNMADNVLHAVVALACLYYGFLAKGKSVHGGVPTPPPPPTPGM